DIFSIGVCLYELIAGEKPFYGANEIMCLKAILEEEPVALSEYAPDCPEAIEVIIYRALMKQREERWDSARQFQLELQDVLKTCPTPLGRHVVAEFIKSFTEAGTTHFDVSKVRIPRSHKQIEGETSGSRPGVRFASSHSSVPLAEPQPD